MMLPRAGYSRERAQPMGANKDRESFPAIESSRSKIAAVPLPPALKSHTSALSGTAVLRCLVNLTRWGASQRR